MVFINSFQPQMLQPFAQGGCNGCHSRTSNGQQMNLMSIQMNMMMNLMSMMTTLLGSMLASNQVGTTLPSLANFGGLNSIGGAQGGLGNFLGTSDAPTGASTPQGPLNTQTPTSLVNGAARPPSGPIAPTSDLRNTNGAKPIDAPKQSQEGARSAQNYNAVIDQFDVERNPRYAQRNGNTYCNIFVSDVTRAMGAEIPHWWQGKEMNANATCDWLKDNGSQFGWKPVSAADAQALANQGKPVVATWKNQGGIGHVGVIRPGEINSNGPALSQAGAKNVNNTHVKNTFGSKAVVYYAHA